MFILPAIAAVTLAIQAQTPVRQFPDVPEGHWAYEAVLNLRREGILHGYPPSPPPPRKED